MNAKTAKKIRKEVRAQRREMSDIVMNEVFYKRIRPKPRFVPARVWRWILLNLIFDFDKPYEVHNR